MSDMSRQQLKKNELEAVVLTAALWIKNNRTKFLSIAGTALGVLIFTVFVLVRYHTSKVHAIDKLAIAQGQLYQGQTDQATKLLDEIIAQQSQSELAAHSRLSKAEFFIRQQNFIEAEKALQPLAESDKPKIIVPLALAELGAARESMGKFNECISTYNLFLEKYPDHFLAPKIHESLSRVYEMTGQPEKAKASYEKIAITYPSTAWAMRAQERLAAISGAGSPRPAPAAQPDNNKNPQK